MHNLVQPAHSWNQLHVNKIIYLAELCIEDSKGPFTQAIFVAATGCNFCRAKVVTSFKHVRNPFDIVATNRAENRTWLTCAILKLQL